MVSGTGCGIRLYWYQNQNQNQNQIPFHCLSYTSLGFIVISEKLDLKWPGSKMSRMILPGDILYTTPADQILWKSAKCSQRNRGQDKDCWEFTEVRVTQSWFIFLCTKILPTDFCPVKGKIVADIAKVVNQCSCRSSFRKIYWATSIEWSQGRIQKFWKGMHKILGSRITVFWL